MSYDYSRHNLTKEAQDIMRKHGKDMCVELRALGEHPGVEIAEQAGEVWALSGDTACVEEVMSCFSDAFDAELRRRGGK